MNVFITSKVVPYPWLRVYVEPCGIYDCRISLRHVIAAYRCGISLGCIIWGHMIAAYHWGIWLRHSIAVHHCGTSFQGTIPVESVAPRTCTSALLTLSWKSNIVWLDMYDSALANMCVKSHMWMPHSGHMWLHTCVTSGVCVCVCVCVSVCVCVCVCVCVTCGSHTRWPNDELIIRSV